MPDNMLGKQGEPRTTPEAEEQIEMAARQRENLPRTDPTDEIEFEGDTAGDPALEHAETKSMHAPARRERPPSGDN